MDPVTLDADTGDVVRSMDAGLYEPARLLLPGGRTEHIDLIEGGTVRELLSGIPSDMHSMLTVYNHGTVVADWDGFRLRAGDRILITLTPQGGGSGGGKRILGAILMIVVAIYAPYAGGAIATYMGASAAVGTMIGVGLTMVAGMVISALIAPPTISTGNLSPSSPGTYALSGQSNQPRPYNTCLVVYGQYKMMPAIASNPDVDNFATTSILSTLYDFGLGWVTLQDIRIGDVSIYNYHPALVVHTNDYADNLQLCPNRIGYDQYALNMAQNQPITVRTKLDSYAANLDINFPKGIFQAAPAYGQLPYWADFMAYWRKVGDSVWNEVPIDWYYGAMGRAYTTPPPPGINYRLSDHDIRDQWTPYQPSTSPADLRNITAQWNSALMAGGTDLWADYRAVIPNPYISWGYPGAFINDADYFGRYPDIKKTGWTADATYHFQAIGSREGRDPGVPMNWNVNSKPPTYTYSPSASPTQLHAIDKQLYPTAGQVGGWRWIDSGRTTQPVPAPIEWQIADSSSWNDNNYLARYPDVAASGLAAWDHFTIYGAYEGRDPYTNQFIRSVRLTACWVGSYWMRIFFQFPSPGEYELQVVRTDTIEDGTDATISQASGGAVTARVDESVIALLRSYEWGQPVLPRLRHTMMEMRVVATDQLSGIVQNLSAVVTSVLQQTNDGSNFWWGETRNPAWICIDMMTSEKNPKPLSFSQIDWASWIHLAQVCDTLRSYVVNGAPYTGPRYMCDLVLDNLATVKSLVESVLAGCRSSLVLTQAGTWGVLHDEEKTVPRQLITPANSWGFSGVRTFVEYPHALRVNFVNRDAAWVKDEVIVYADGYYAGNATLFETLDTFGVTDYPHAWAYGRYMLAQGIERNELFTLSMDVENLLVQRGDMVYVQNDVPMVGGVPAKVVAVQGQGVLIDRVLAQPPTGYAVRLSDGTIRTGAAYADDTYPPGLFGLDSIAGIQSDDLIVLGDYTRETQPYLVQAITPGQDLSAQLTLCKYVPGVYTADIGALPPWDPGFGRDYINGTDLVSFDLVATQTLYYVARMPMVDVHLVWQTTGYNFDHHELTVILPSGQRIALDSTLGPTAYDWIVDAISERQYFDIALQFEVTPVSKLGFRGQQAYSSITLARDTTPPAAVLQFGVNVQKENVDIFWQAGDDPDIAAYLLRYTPEAQYPNWNASQVLSTIAWPTTKTQAGARTGSYGIRVVDTSGNLSDVVWRRTTVAFLPDINVVTVLNDRDLPTPWPGLLSHVEVHGSEVMSEGAFGAVYPDGIYYFSYPVDLGDVYEVRVSSKIEAYAVTAADYMAAWLSLADLDAMAHMNSALWDAWLEVRTADHMSFMAGWATLSSISSMAAGDDSEWSGWRPCQVGDYTAQLMQFRIVLQSKNPGVRVVVSSGRVEVDMPDRIDTYGDVQVPTAGLDFVYPVAFRKVEAVAITIDGNAQPVVAKVTNKTAEGLHVQLTNTVTSAAAPGQIDIMAQGYGRRRTQSI